ncbi:MAG TPA: hypothetical protein VK963_04605 [Candidatus Saccharimonadales bacterium]|nr:hypothetical protein [Candidatus Saccharimonadales bacterium]
MTDTFSERRLAENEVIFRSANQRIMQAVEQSLHGQTGDLPLEFYCECSNEDCRQRISATPQAFTAVHSNPKRFIIVKGHQRADIEKVVEACGNYDIVEKFKLPPQETDGRLNRT